MFLFGRQYLIPKPMFKTGAKEIIISMLCFSSERNFLVNIAWQEISVSFNA